MTKSILDPDSFDDIQLSETSFEIKVWFEFGSDFSILISFLSTNGLFDTGFPHSEVHP